MLVASGLYSSCRYHLLQLLLSIVLLDGDLAISFESFVELVSDVPFHAVCSTIITEAADMSPATEVPERSVHYRNALTSKDGTIKDDR